MKSLAEILAALRAHLDANPDDGGEKGAVVKALREDFALEVGNPLVGIGAAKGKGEVERTTLKAITKERDELKAEAERLEARAAELEKKVPDIETVRNETRAQLKAKDDAHKAELKAKDEKIIESARKRERARIESELKGVVADFAVESLADKAEKRIRPNDDGTVDLLGLDGISLGQTSDPDVLATFVKSVTKGLRPELVLAPAGDRGSDTGRRRGTLDTPAAAKKDEMTELRNEKMERIGYGI